MAFDWNDASRPRDRCPGHLLEYGDEDEDEDEYEYGAKPSVER
jgi:hypothetical protein